jgi:cytochrome c biogenesis protein CcdA
LSAIEWMSDGRTLSAFGLALVLGLRHASDPDHVTAVATLAISERRGARAAAGLGLAWGLGHALTLVLLGLPVVLANARIPDFLQRAAELGVGLLIVCFALRLLNRWRRGELHVHRHAHGALEHAHPHFHGGSIEHAHAHLRSPLAAFGVGLVHGVGGSAAAAILMLASLESRASAALALALFAVGTAGAMAIASAALGFVLARGPLARRIERLAPAVGVASLAFGAWYAFAALG